MTASSKKAAYAALAGNCLIAITKFAAAFFTGSSAMLSEGIHSAVDTGNEILLLYGIKKAKLPANERFPFGRGKEIYFWSFVVAILIFSAGAGFSIYEGVAHIKNPHPVAHPTASFIVLGLSFLFESGSFYVAARQFNRTRGNRGFIEAVRYGKDPTLFVILFEDSAALLGLATAAMGLTLALITGNEFWDGAASLIIGLILGVTATWLARETKGLLIGEAAAPAVRKKISALANEFPSIERINNVLTLHMGPEYIIANISVEFSDDLSIGDVEQINKKLTRRIKRDHPHIKRVFIEAEDKTP